MLNFVYLPLGDIYFRPKWWPQSVAILVITPKPSLTGKICDGTISHIIMARISLYNKQFHRHFGSKKMLNFVYFHLDDIHFQSKIHGGHKLYHILIVMISSVIPEILVLWTRSEQFDPKSAHIRPTVGRTLKIWPLAQINLSPLRNSSFNFKLTYKENVAKQRKPLKASQLERLPLVFK